MAETNKPKIEADKASSGLSFGSSVAMFLPALTTLLGVGATVKDIEARSDAIIANMNSEVESFRYSQNVMSEQLDELDRAVGDRMTERGVETLKMEARLRASSAETGTTGGSTHEAIKDAYMQEALDMAVLQQQGRTSRVSMLRKMQSERLGLRNRLTSLSSGMQSGTSAGLSTLNTGLGSFNTGLNMLNTLQREELFNTSKGKS